MTCLHCQAPTTNGLALCDLCRAAASFYLEFLPIYFRNLARWRPGRAGARPVPASREPQGDATGGEDRVSRALNEAGNDVTTWARELADDRCLTLPDGGDEAGSIIAACRMLNENLTSIATLSWAGDFVTGLRAHEARLQRLTLDVVPGWYAGACRHCGSLTYVVPGLTWVKCSACGVTTYARDHLDVILDEARDWIARPMRLAEAAVALLDTEMSVPRLHKRISKWGERGRLDVVRESDYAPKRYRFGEVLDALASEGVTRLDDVDTARSA